MIQTDAQQYHMPVHLLIILMSVYTVYYNIILKKKHVLEMHVFHQTVTIYLAINYILNNLNNT